MAKHKRLLLIDDDEKILSLLEKSLKREIHHIEIECAFDGVSASHEVEQNKYDLIITDLNMPRKTGHSFLKRVKFSKHNADTPLVVLTGFPDDNLVREYAPIFQVEKPFQYKEVVTLAKNLIGIDKRQLKNHHHVFQAFLAGFEKICNKKGMDIHDVSQPWIRVDGHGLSGYLHLYFEMEIEKNHSSFNISLDKDLVQRLYLEYTGKSIKEDENSFLVAGEEMSKILFHEIGSYLTNMDKDPPKLLSHGTFLGTESAQYLKTQHQQGFCIDILTSIGKIQVQSLMDNLHSKTNIA